MDARAALEEATLGQRLALLALIELDHDGETPANALLVRDCCGAHIQEITSDVLGPPGEVDVSRTLNELADAGLVTETKTDPSATGKGRPAYEVAVSEDVVLAALADDERLESMVGSVRDADD